VISITFSLPSQFCFLPRFSDDAADGKFRRLSRLSDRR
jgi:hypothetical protein